MRFLVDENLPMSLTEMLREEGHEVLDVREAGLRGASDETIWQTAGRQHRIVITRDLDFPLPGVHPIPKGVVLVRVPDTWTGRQIVRLVRDGFEELDRLEQLERQITVLTPGQIRMHELEHGSSHP